MDSICWFWKAERKREIKCVIKSAIDQKLVYSSGSGPEAASYPRPIKVWGGSSQRLLFIEAAAAVKHSYVTECFTNMTELTQHPGRPK